MKYKLAMMTLLAAATVTCLGSGARAGGLCGGWSSGGYGFGYGINRSYRTDREIPYFAEFPPVYYSYPVPRTYGYSPYAYPPSVMTPTLYKEAEPRIITNPYVAPAPRGGTGAEPAKSAADRPQPKVVLNPFVDQNRSIAATGR